MNKEILRLAIPNIVSNISIPLLGVVDTFLMGKMESPAYIGAVAIAGIVFSFIYWGFGFLRMGTTGLTAQAFGRKDDNEIFYTLVRAVGLAIISGLLIIICQKTIAVVSFEIINASAEINDIALPYYYIRIWGAPAAIAIYALNGWFFGMQNSTYPMIITIFLNLLNIILNYIFVFHFGMKANGVALGTVIAQYGSFILAVFLFFQKYKHFWRPIQQKALLKIDELKRFFTVNFDIFLRTLCLIFAFAFFTSKSENEGMVLLAVNSILLQYMSILSYGIDGFAFAVESLTGKYYGKHDQHQLNTSIQYVFYWGMGFAVIYMLAFFLIRNQMVDFFTDDEAVIAASLPFVWWLIAMPIPNTIAFIWDGVYIGLTATKAMRNTMFIATFLFFVPCYYLLHPYLGNHALWLCMVSFMLVRGIGLSILARKVVQIK